MAVRRAARALAQPRRGAARMKDSRETCVVQTAKQKVRELREEIGLLPQPLLVLVTLSRRWIANRRAFRSQRLVGATGFEPAKPLGPEPSALAKLSYAPLLSSS